MKHHIIITASVLGLSVMLSSCGGSKDTSAYNYPSQQAINSQQGGEQAVKQPTMTKRELDECITMAQDESNNRFRAYGTASSFQEEYAMQNAEANAVAAMIRRFETAGEEARQSYNKDANMNSKKLTEGEIQSIFTQFAVGAIKDYRVIKTSLYDMSDGSIRCYVCIELRNTKEEMIKSIGNTLSQNNILTIEEDKKKFMNLIQPGLDEYKRRRQQEEANN